MNLVYMARPVYGGWITITAHLALTYAGPVLSKNGTMTKAEFDEYTINIKSAIANCREGNLL